MEISTEKINTFQKRLRGWGEEGIKNYPWRYREDPYSILVSEFMLHRTQTSQARQVYETFMERWPTLEDFKKAGRNEVKSVLEPLGLNWRIEGMINVLNSLWKQYEGVPHDREKLIKEKNVGQYIAGATETFATNQPQTLIDTNTVRVVGRIFGLDLEGEARRRKEVKNTIELVCDRDNPRDFYYAIIDLAHQICTPRNPECDRCPILEVPCKYGKEIIAKGKSKNV